MKFKVYVVDLDLPRGLFKQVLSLGLPIALLLGATAVLQASVPNEFKTGDTLTAQSLNENFQALHLRTVPAGTIAVFGGAAPPPGWLLCDGSEANRLDDADLFNAIGIAWGGGDGTTTFNVPDLRGVFLRGLDPDGLHDPDGSTRENASLQLDTLGKHTHSASDKPHTHPTWSTYKGANLADGNFFYAGSNDGLQHGSTDSSSTAGITIDATGGDETRPVNVAVNYIIKL